MLTLVVFSEAFNCCVAGCSVFFGGYVNCNLARDSKQFRKVYKSSAMRCHQVIVIFITHIFVCAQCPSANVSLALLALSFSLVLQRHLIPHHCYR